MTEMVDVPAAKTPAWPHQWWRGLKGRMRTSLRPRYVMVPGGDVSSPAATQDWSAWGQAFDAWCGDNPGVKCVLGLSERLLMHALTDEGLAPDEALSQAHRQWMHYMEMDESSLANDWVCRQVAVGSRQLLSAAPRGLVDALQDAARRHGVSLQWMGPWWARPLQVCLSAAGGDGGDALTQLRLSEPGLHVLVDAELPEKSSQPVLRRLWVEMGDEPSASRAAATSMTATTAIAPSTALASMPAWDLLSLEMTP